MEKISNESVWLKLLDVHDDYIELITEGTFHSADMTDWVDAIHTLQRIVCKRELEERCPEWFK